MRGGQWWIRPGAFDPVGFQLYDCPFSLLPGSARRHWSLAPICRQTAMMCELVMHCQRAAAGPRIQASSFKWWRWVTYPTRHTQYTTYILAPYTQIPPTPCNVIDQLVGHLVNLVTWSVPWHPDLTPQLKIRNHLGRVWALVVTLERLCLRMTLRTTFRI